MRNKSRAKRNAWENLFRFWLPLFLLCFWMVRRLKPFPLFSFARHTSTERSDTFHSRTSFLSHFRRMNLRSKAKQTLDIVILAVALHCALLPIRSCPIQLQMIKYYVLWLLLLLWFSLIDRRPLEHWNVKWKTVVFALATMAIELNDLHHSVVCPLQSN